MKINRIMILVETDDGHARQVLAPAEQKEICLVLLRDEGGTLKLSERLQPVVLERYRPVNPPAAVQPNPTPH